jgi:hypothetical protein
MRTLSRNIRKCDNVLISLCHARLFTTAILRLLTLRPLRRRE